MPVEKPEIFSGFLRFSLEEFTLLKPPFFIFSQKNIVKFLCLRKEVLRIAYIYKKEDCDCRYCLYYSNLDDVNCIRGL